MKYRIATLFGSRPKIIYRAFVSSVPARLCGFITIPFVGSTSGAYQVTDMWSLTKAVAMYSTLGFFWALLVEANWHHIQRFFGVKK
jgi:hypothetical protein